MEISDSKYELNDINQTSTLITNEKILKKLLENFIRKSNKSSHSSDKHFKTLSKEINIHTRSYVTALYLKNHVMCILCVFINKYYNTVKSIL